MRVKLPLPCIAVLVATGCQAIWGDFRYDDSALHPTPEPEEPCDEAGVYRCDDATLKVCLDANSNWVDLVPCQAGLLCDAMLGRCRDPGEAPAGGTGGVAGTGGAASKSGGGSSTVSGGSLNSGGASGGTGGDRAGASNSGGIAQGGDPTVSGGISAAAGAGGECSMDAPGCGPTMTDDACPSDSAKTEPGVCGCGVPDVDSDADGALDCKDGCPIDGKKTAPGACGCGVVDSLSCAVLRASLAQRYSFDGTGATAQNSVVAGQVGLLQNTMLTGTGALELAGTTTDQFVDLPNGMVSSLVNATFEAWLTWRGGAAWQRVFDFGSNQNAEGMQGTGATYLFLTPMATNTAGFARVAFTTAGNAAETKIDAKRAFTVGAVSHVAVVVDDDNNLISLYLDGALQASVAFTSQLALLSDVNSWLGRSQFSTDPELDASLDEFRIYRVALSAADLAASFSAGPNPAFLVR